MFVRKYIHTEEQGFIKKFFGFQNQPHFFCIRSAKLRILFQFTTSYLVLSLKIFQIKNFAVKICQIKKFFAKICQIPKNKLHFLFPGWNPVEEYYLPKVAVLSWVLNL